MGNGIHGGHGAQAAPARGAGAGPDRATEAPATREKVVPSEDMVAAGFELPRELKTRLGCQAALAGRSMESVAAEAIEAWLDAREGAGTGEGE